MDSSYGRFVAEQVCDQSYKCSTIIIYHSRVVPNMKICFFSQNIKL